MSTSLPNKKAQTKWGIFSCFVMAFLFNSAIFSTLHAQNLGVTFTFDEACATMAQGTVYATATGGSGGYTYLWNTGGTTSSVRGMAGQYTVTVSDGSGASIVRTANLPIASSNPTTIITSTSCGPPWTLTANVTGGEAPYLYRWKDGELEGQTITVSMPGTYCVTVVDNNRCGQMKCITLTNEPPAVSVRTNNIVCNGNNNGRLEAVPSRGNPPYSYFWSTGATTQVLNNVGPGLYTVTLTDAGGCTASASGRVQDAPAITVNPLVTNPACAGNATGRIVLDIRGGTPPFTILWNTGSRNSLLENLADGTYRATVTDANQCSTTVEATIAARSNLSISTQGSNQLCAGDNAGNRVSVTASNGVTPYTYRWSNSAATATVNNTAPGTYTVTVTDAAGCSATGSATITAAPNFNITVTGSALTACTSTDGTASVTVSGGTAPISYRWSTGSNASSISGLAEGTYVVTVTDGNQCVKTGQYRVLAPPAVNLSVTTNSPICPGTTSGLAQASASGGTAPYTYAWSSGQTTASIVGLAPGTYTVTVTDSKSCTAVRSVTIVASPAITASITAPSVVCASQGAGTVQVIATGGTAPLRYAWSTGSTSASISVTQSGTYTVTVTDSRGCSVVRDRGVTVVNDLVVTINSTNIPCFGQTTGSASANVSGGTAPYTYSWNNGATGAQITGLGAGTYRVTVTESNGCTATQSVTITQPSQLNTTISKADIACNGMNSGSASISATGGTPAYTYLWSNGQTTAQISNLAVGTYTVTVTDANGCTSSKSTSIVQSTAITLTTTKTDANCAGDANGTAQVTAAGGTSPYTYLWSNTRTTASITGLTAGTYTVTVTDSRACTATATVTISSPPALTVTTNTGTVCAGTTGGSLTATPAGGTSPYTFRWTGNRTGATVSSLAPGTYTVTVTDSKNCTATTTATISSFPTPTCTVVVIKSVTNPLEPDGIAEVRPTGGVAPYTYLWDNGRTTAQITGLSSGVRSVTVTDANGCQTTCQATIPALAGLGDMVWEDLDRDGVMDGGEPGVPGIKVKLKNAAGQVIDSTVTNEQGKYTFFGLNPGTYSVMFTLPNGYKFTTQNNAADDVDSDADLVMGMTATTNLTAGQYDPTLDAGIYLMPMTTIEPTCECLNNATTQSNGQFRQRFVITSYPGETWRVISRSNAYSTASPAPPAAPIALPVNTTLTEIAPGSYELVLRSLDGITYAVTISNGVNQITVTKECSYPKINVAAFPADLCILDEPITLSATPSEPGIVTFILNGTLVTSINPATLGAGSYTLEVKFTPTNPTSCQAVRTISFVVNEDCFAKVGDFVWYDVNQNGQQDINEPGVPGVVVILTGTTSRGVPYTDTLNTASNGMYMFMVPPGTYKVTFIKPGDFIFTSSNVGNDASDSDADPVMGMTQTVTVGRGEKNLTLDAGLYTFCANLTDPGALGGNQMICAPGADPAPITSVRLPSGGSGVIEYVWMYSTVGGQFNRRNWFPIPNSNAPTYDPGPLYETTYFVRCARRVGCETFFEPDPVVITVKSTILPSINGNIVACVGKNYTARVNGFATGSPDRWPCRRCFTSYRYRRYD